MKIFFLLLFLFVLIATGCRKNTHREDCFKLKSVFLHDASGGGCETNVWLVEESPDSEVPPGTYVDFVTDQSQYPTNVKPGDVITIHLKMKVKVLPGIDKDCPVEYTYLLQGDFCK